MQNLIQIETVRPTFEGMKLEDVALKPGHIRKYEPAKEKLEQVELKAAPKVEKEAAAAGANVPKPQWAIDRKLGNVESRFNFDIVEQISNYLIELVVWSKFQKMHDQSLN